MTEVLRYAAFTLDGDGGNPAGVVLDARGMTEAEMLTVASEVGYSETAFVLPGSTAGAVRMRYFSPLAEVAFCGHATVATAVALAEREGCGRIEVETLAGPVTVETAPTEEGVVATMTSPPTSSTPVDETVLDRTLDALHWSRDDLDPAYPVHVASAGNDHLVVTAVTAERLADLDYDFDALGGLMEEQGWTTVDLVWPETPTTFHSRNPFPPGGVVEDPATGAAAAALGGYLRQLGLVDVPGRVVVLQGHHIGRPSRLVVDLADAGPDGSARSRVSGLASPIPDDDASRP